MNAVLSSVFENAEDENTIWREELAEKEVSRPISSAVGDADNTAQDTQPEPQATASGREASIDRSFVHPKLEIIPTRNRIVQQWEGRVDVVSEEDFTAVLRDRHHPSISPEEVVLSMEDVDPADHPLVMPGAIFYWTIGYREIPRPREKFSRIRFRRLIQREPDEHETRQMVGYIEELLGEAED